MQLQEKFGDKVHAITLCLDWDGEGRPPPEMFGEVQTALESAGVTLDNVLCTDAAESVFEKLEVGGVPAMLVFGADGSLVHKVDGAVDYVEVTKFIETL